MNNFTFRPFSPKPSANLSKLIYERNGLLVTNSRLLADVFHVFPEHMFDMIRDHGQHSSLSSAEFKVSLEPELAELSFTAFEQIMFPITRKIYWRGTYMKILKEFQRELARLNASGKQSKLFVESN